MSFFWQFSLILLSPFIFLVIWFFLFFILTLIQKRCIPPLGSALVKKRSILRRFFIDFPLKFWADFWTRNPEAFKEFGLHIIAGEQGSGKTITCAYLLRKYQNKYPKMKVRTNFFYKSQDSAIKHWKDFIFQSNGILGEIIVLDEIQNWFSSSQARDFPPDMLQEITQQRKQRKMIIGTSQVFQRVSKPIREQTTLLYEPFTILGCMTVCRVYKPIIDDLGHLKDKRFVKMFFFIHDDNLRDSFDTYHKIEKLSKGGFIPSPFQPESPLVVSAEKN